MDFTMAAKSPEAESGFQCLVVTVDLPIMKTMLPIAGQEEARIIIMPA
jgi:hypothetical protein